MHFSLFFFFLPVFSLFSLFLQKFNAPGKQFVLGLFGEPSGDLRGTFGEPLGNLWGGYRRELGIWNEE